MSAKRDVDQLVKQVKKLGHDVEATGSGHWKVFAPGGVVFISATPRGPKALHAARGDLRRNGVTL
jgi:hypothetical protein